MSNEIDKSQYVEVAKKLAEKMAGNLIRSYTQAVVNSLQYYDEEPDEDDFFSWVEGYDWSDPDKDFLR